MTDKKDLTRIEDLQEFVHEGDTGDDSPPDNGDESSDPPLQNTTDFSIPLEMPPDDLPIEETPSDDLPIEETPLDDYPLGDTPPDDLPVEDIASEVPVSEDFDGQPDLTPTVVEKAEKVEEAITAIENTEGPNLQTTLEEVQKFSTHLTYGQLSLGQGPPFAVAIRNIKDEETKNELRRLLGETGLEVSHFEQGLALGSILVGQISEYCAIFLAHKLRNLDVEIELGPSVSIHPPQNYEDEANRGIPQIPAKNQSLEQGQNLDEWKHDDFFISTTSHSPYTIKEHLGPIQAVRKISPEQLANLPEIQDIDFSETDYQDYLGHYQNLVQELKDKAIKQRAHGLLQLSFQLMPLTTKDKIIGHQLLVTGNLVRF